MVSFVMDAAAAACKNKLDLFKVHVIAARTVWTVTFVSPATKQALKNMIRCMPLKESHVLVLLHSH
jgi:hypothetical protein